MPDPYIVPSKQWIENYRLKNDSTVEDALNALLDDIRKKMQSQKNLPHDE